MGDAISDSSLERFVWRYFELLLIIFVPF
jgi:hypothetical protein